MLTKLRQISDDLRARMNKSTDENGRWLRAVPRAHYAYFAAPRNSRALQLFYDEVTRLWFRRLRRRGQRRRISWEKMKPCIRRYLPRPRIVHPRPT